MTLCEHGGKIQDAQLLVIALSWELRRALWLVSERNRMASYQLQVKVQVRRY
jgi:hypothetical protein